MSAQIQTFYRTWRLVARQRTVTGQKENFTFKITKLPGFTAALRAGKREINEREGPEAWIVGYTNEALL